MELPTRLAQALERCGHQLPAGPLTYRPLGAGAWHDAYFVTSAAGEQLVVRLRKRIIYGREEPFDAQALHADYAPVGLYYSRANAIWPGICPRRYAYHIEPGFSFTVESYLGSSLVLEELERERALAYGRELGAFFRAMHAAAPPVVGHGLVSWEDGLLVGKDRRPAGQIWREQLDSAQEQLEQLADGQLAFGRAALRSKLRAILDGLEPDQPALVNRDITPENLIVRAGNAVGLIDPVPLVGGAARFGAWLPCLYRFLLPALGDTPRYSRHQFRSRVPQLAALAEGYEQGYASDPELRQRLQVEQFLILLGIAASWHRLLQAPVLTPEAYLRNGSVERIAARLQLALRTLEHWPI